MRLTLARIPKGRIATGKGDLPKVRHLAIYSPEIRMHLVDDFNVLSQVVHNFIEQEFLRSCTIAFASLPKVSHREGWGAPGTKHEGTRFRTAILDTVGAIGTCTSSWLL